MSQLDEALDGFEQEIGLSKYKPDLFDEDELSGYLNMPRDVIERLSSEECDVIGLRLCQFAFHIQRAHNREIARNNWADNSVHKAIAPHLQNVPGYGLKEKYHLAVKQDTHAIQLESIRQYTKQRADRLAFLGSSINNMVDMLKKISYSKNKVEK